MDNIIFKIKDSVDIYVHEPNVLTIYYMNSRRRKTFRVNQCMIDLLECIDGESTTEDIITRLKTTLGLNEEEIQDTLKLLVEYRIITEKSSENILSNYDLQRYARQINYFSEFLRDEKCAQEAQKRLMESHIAILGCGAIGGNMAIQLVMSGVQQLTILDYDVVSTSDIARHMYFDNYSIGMQKTELLKSKLEAIDSRVRIRTINKVFRPEDDLTEILHNIDFVINSLDEPYIGYTSSKISRFCVKHRIPHYIAGGFDAHLASTGELIIPYMSPCVECYASHFKTSLANWKPKKHPVIERSKEIGGLPSMSLFSSSFGVMEIIKYITGLVDLNKEYKVRGEWTFTDMNLQYLKVEKDPECLICGANNEA